MTSQLRTLTFGDRRISYDEEARLEIGDDDADKDYSSLNTYQFSDMDSGVCEDVCCDVRDVRGTPDTERKIIKPDVSTIRQLTNFDEDDEEGRETEEETEDDEDDEEVGDVSEEETEDDEAEDVPVVRFSAQSSVRAWDDTGYSYHSLGPASLSVLQLDRSELVHMRHVMVKIELDSREQENTVSRVEAGRVCVVCTTSTFGLWTGVGLQCSVCRYVVCSHCTAGNITNYSPPPPSPSPSSQSSTSSPTSPLAPNSPSGSITARLGTLFSGRRRSLDSQVLCRPCSQFVEQMNLMTEEDEFNTIDNQRSM